RERGMMSILIKPSDRLPSGLTLLLSEKDKKEPLEENQLFIVELARDLNRVCQRSDILQNIWNLDDIWPTPLCRAFILEWASMLESKVLQSVWPGEPVAKVLDDLQSAWRWGRMPNLLTAMELVMWTLILQIWDWISDAAVEVTLDLDTANPDLLISNDEKRMRCGFERKDVPNYHQRFDGWWCAVGVEGFSSGRHYWEVEVGERDWRLGVAKESALRKGFKSLNTDTGYLTLRLERGTELKALTVPFTALPPGLIPRKVGVYLDYDQGQLSFYDVDTHSHIYTYNERFTEKLFPLFGTVEIIKDLVIRSPAVKTHCLCPTSCFWG
uniref:Si:ch73-364h19.2 n=1 Tax=Myripristis murdjan TaxID=586833 RepID=A0A667YFS8_9TELE